MRIADVASALVSCDSQKTGLAKFLRVKDVNKTAVFSVPACLFPQDFNTAKLNAACG
jgi:hypothetical protein